MDLFERLKDKIIIEKDIYDNPKRLVLELTDKEDIEEFIKLVNPVATLEDLDISVRTFNSIRYYFGRVKNHYDTITVEMIKNLFDSEEILKVKNLGRKSRKELKDALLNMNIKVDWKN